MSWFTRTLSFRNVEDDDRRQSAGARGNSNQSVSSAGRTFDNSSDADFFDHDHEHEHQPQQPVNPPRQAAAPRSTPPQSTRYSSPPTRQPSQQRLTSPARTPSQRITSPPLSRTPSQRQSSPRSRPPSTNLMSRSNSGNMNYSPNGQPPMRYSGSMQPAPSNIFAPVVDPSTGATMRGPMGSTLNRQSSGTMMPMDYASPMGGYAPNSPMPPSSGASVMMAPSMPRPASMNMGGGGASVAPGMAMGMNNLSMNNMALGMNGGMNGVSMNGVSMNNMNGMAPMGMSTLGVNTLGPNAMSPMMSVGGAPGGLSPMVMTPAGLSPMAPVGATGLGMMPAMSTMNMVGGVSPYGGVSTAGTAGLIPLNPATPAVLSPMLPSAGAAGVYNPLDPTGQMAYLSPVGRLSLNGSATTSATATSSDPALELALRQSMVDSAPRWMTDRSYQAAREEAMKKQNDDMLERAIRQSLDETNLHRLRQDEIERSNRILQQSNDRALEEAIRASLQDYSHEDIQRAKSVDAIEQANEDALQRAILQSMQGTGGGGAGGGGAASSMRATATMTTTTTMTSSQRLAAAASSSSSIGLTGGSPRAVPMSRVNPPPSSQQQQQSQQPPPMRSPQPPPAAGLARMHSANGASMYQNQPYRPGPFPPEPPPQMPYYQVQYQQTLQQQQQYYPPDAYGYDDGGYDDPPPPPPTTGASARSQMMMGMMMRHSFDDRDDGHGAAGDDDDEYMQPASYANTPQQQPHGPHTLRQQPSSQFISVGNGQGRSSGTGMMRDPNNPNNNDGETVVSSTSSGAGIGRNTAAQVTSLYLNNPDLIEQEMQQRYQRQYQLYLQQQLAQADVANQRLASTSQDAYDQIHHHHHQQQQQLQQPPSVARAVFDAVPDQPPAMYPGGAPMRQQSSQRQRISSQHQTTPSQPHDEDQDDNQTRNSSGNLSGGTGTSAARRLSQTQSFIGNPLMQSRISAVAHHQQQHQHQQQQQQQQSQPQPQPASQAAAGSLQSPNQAAFMEKLRRKSGSQAPTGAANDNGDGPNGGFSPAASYPDDGHPTHRGAYQQQQQQQQQQSPPPPGYDAPMTSSGKSQGASSLTMSTKSTSGRSFHVPRASFHQFVDGAEGATEPNGFNDAAFHPHGGHHQLGVHHEAPHRLSKHEVLVERDEYGIPLTVDEKHHPHLHQLKATLSQTQMSLSSDSDLDDDDVNGKQLRPRLGSNGNMQRPSLTNIAIPAAAAAFPTATPNGGKTMKKTFSAPKMIDAHADESPATTPVAAKAARPGLYDRSLVESVDLDPSKIKIQRKIIHHAAKPL